MLLCFNNISFIFYLWQNYLQIICIVSSCCLSELNSKAGPKVQLDTEVWTWGCGSSGQLGHGDLLDRSVWGQPSKHLHTLSYRVAWCNKVV